MMIQVSLVLSLVFGAPEVAPACATPEVRAGSTVAVALETVVARLTKLEELASRRATGEQVSLHAVRSGGSAPTGGHEILARELARIKDLRDEIRIAQATRRTPTRKAPGEEKALATTTVEAPPNRSAPAPTAGPRDLRLAEVRYQAGRLDGALTLYEASAKRTGDTWSRLRIGRCLERLGRTPEARKAYEALVKDHPSDRWAKAARWSLDMLDFSASVKTEETATSEGKDGR